MTLVAHNKKSVFKLRIMAALLLVAIVFSPRPSAAQCENPIMAAAAAGVAIGIQSAAIIAQDEALRAATKSELTNLKNAIIRAIDDLETQVITERMRQFAEDSEAAWKGMNGQLTTSSLIQAMNFGQMIDTNNMNSNARIIEDMELARVKQYQPTEEACVFDTIARHALYAGVNAKRVSTAAVNEIDTLGNNQDNTPAKNGQAGVQKMRNQKRQAFCNPNANGGVADCTGTPDPTLVDADKLPGRTIFGRYTIDLKGADARTVINEIIFNLTGYKVPDTMTDSTLNAVGGKEQRAQNREYLTQMNAVTAALTGIVGERTAGESAPKVQEIREKIVAPCPPDQAPGFSDCASPTPSQREIRKAKEEEMFDPNYYTNTYDNVSTITQKQILVSAYNLSLLYKLIDKTERISGIYAIEAGNMLQKQDKSRDAGADTAPTK